MCESDGARWVRATHVCSPSSTRCSVPAPSQGLCRYSCCCCCGCGLGWWRCSRRLRLFSLSRPLPLSFSLSGVTLAHADVSPAPAKRRVLTPWFPSTQASPPGWTEARGVRTRVRWTQGLVSACLHGWEPQRRRDGGGAGRKASAITVWRRGVPAPWRWRQRQSGRGGSRHGAGRWGCRRQPCSSLARLGRENLPSID